MKKILVMKVLFRCWSTENEEPKKFMQRGTRTGIRNCNHWSNRRSFHLHQPVDWIDTGRWTAVRAHVHNLFECRFFQYNRFCTHTSNLPDINLKGVLLSQWPYSLKHRICITKIVNNIDILLCKISVHINSELIYRNV